MNYPTQKGIIGSPRDSAINSMTQANDSHAAAIKSLSGGKKRRGKKRTRCKHKRHHKSCGRKRSANRRKRTRRRGGALEVPQFTMQYESQSGADSDPNSIIKNSSVTSTQMEANKQYDHLVGGYEKRRKMSKRSRRKR